MNVMDLRDDVRVLLDGPGQPCLIRRGAQAVLVDTGTAGHADAIETALRSWGLGKDALTHVLLTHWHPDHAGSAAELSTWPNVQIWAHRADAPIIRGDQAGLPPDLTATEREFLVRVVGELPAAPPCRVDRELDDLDDLDDLAARVIATPGHTPGSIAFHFYDAAILFTGDLVSQEDGEVILGPFHTDRSQARKSVGRLAGLDIDIVCFGHGAPLQGTDTTKLSTAAAHPQHIRDPFA